MPTKTNETLYRIKKALDLSINQILDIYALEFYSMNEEHLESLLKRRSSKGFKVCSYEELGLFLDGLISYKRGPNPKKKSSDEDIELTNNLILKKLRVALELKEAEIEIIFALADVNLTKQQLSSLFRKESHKNFKYCSDELLMSFLDGLDEFYYNEDVV
jgi:uncharacterized protein YehS (DUF1456 family)